jgi:magnesium transporter
MALPVRKSFRIRAVKKKLEERKPEITIIDYDEHSFQEKKVKTIEECFPFKETPSITWINIDGINDKELIEKIVSHFNFHPLLIEEIQDIERRPKIEDFEDYVFLLLKVFQYDEILNEINSEQISIIFGKNYVISFQENPGDPFNPIREKIRTSKGRIRKMGTDYLVYSLLDIIIDNYFFVLEKVGEKIELLEEELVSNPKPKTLRLIHNLKQQMIALRKSVWPSREIIDLLQRGELKLIQRATKIYLRDLYEHTIQVIDAIETYRDILSGMIDIYLSSISNKLNEIMKVLTIIATIFIPLTFVAGVYGMNFKFMPELYLPLAYPIVLTAMLLIAAGMLYYFKKKKWI